MISFHLAIYPEVGFLDHMEALFLISLGTSPLFFHSGCTSLHSQQCKNILFSPQAH